MSTARENHSRDDADACDLLKILVLAHAALDQRDHEAGRYVPAYARPRHLPRHHPAWHHQETV